MKKKFRVFATANIGDEAIETLKKRGYDVEVWDRLEPPPKEVIIKKVKSGIDGLITTLRDPIDEEVFAAGEGTLKVVAQDAVGFNNIDRAAANKYKIPFTNTAEVLTDATSEFAFFILGACARKLYPSEQLVRQMKWGAWHPFLPFLGTQVTHKTLSVIGTGRIGKAFIIRSLGFELDILCYDPVHKDEKFVRSVQEVMDIMFENGLTKERHTIRYADFDECLSEGDFISLHVPLLMPDETDHPTYHMIGEREFEIMKKDAILINTSRGPVVDEAALYKALTENKIYGASLDVFEKEPLPPDSPLRDEKLIERVRLFHHFASGTKETRLSTDPQKGMAGRCIQGLIDVLEKKYGGDPKKMPYVVNKEAF